MQINNYTCIPIQTQNNNIILMCSSMKINESFADTNPIITNINIYYGVSRQRKKFPIYYYNPLKIYNLGDIIIKNYKAYLMYNENGGSGSGFAPPRSVNYVSLDYQNDAVYQIGDIVNGSDGEIYILIDFIGQAGASFAPPSNKWKVMG